MYHALQLRMVLYNSFMWLLVYSNSVQPERYMSYVVYAVHQQSILVIGTRHQPVNTCGTALTGDVYFVFIVLHFY